MFAKSSINTIRDQLIENKQTIAVAESVTAGFLQAAFSTAKDAAMFFEGGITAYNLGQKTKHLQVNPIHAQSCNCVSEKVAKSMARSVTEVFISDYGVALCGYCTAAPESGNRLYAYYAIVKGDKLLDSGMIGTEAGEGVPAQHDYVNQVLGKIEKQL